MRPIIIKLSPHARQRLEERNSEHIIYNTENLIDSPCKWYTKEDLIEKSKLYQHSLYVCRKSPELNYMTNGEVEVLFNTGTGVAITVMEVKSKFKPITQYIKPDIIEANKIKKEEKQRMRVRVLSNGTCPDCGEENIPITSAGICARCRKRKWNIEHNGRVYIPYLKLSDDEREKIDSMRRSHQPKPDKDMTEIPSVNITVPENFYQVKAENKPTAMEITFGQETLTTSKNTTDKNKNVINFISILNECGCEIPEKNLTETLNVLLATDMMKDIIMTIVKDENQKALLDLEQMLNVCERKLQHIWEYNGFRTEDDKKFKNFLNWRRILKGAIFFWKKMYQSNALIELQRSWNSYTQDPGEKITLAGDKERTTSIMKRYQITTETFSTILNTRREFTRVFYATSEEQAHENFVKWLSDRQLHENKAKTKIVELSNN